MSVDPFDLAIGGLLLNAFGAGVLAVAVWLDVSRAQESAQRTAAGRRLLATRRLCIAVGGALLMAGFGAQIHGKRLERVADAAPTESTIIEMTA